MIASTIRLFIGILRNVWNGTSDIERYADYVLPIPETDGRVGPLLANVQLQLIAYYMANGLDRSIDNPGTSRRASRSNSRSNPGSRFSNRVAGAHISEHSFQRR